MDYGGGVTNIDTKTGIRYGVIALNSVTGDSLEDLEYDYPFNCPDCGNDSLVKSRSAQYDYFCQSCRTWHMSDDCWGEESNGFHFEDSEYTLVDCLDTNIMVIKSPYYTHARFCSPCVPGAGDLDTPDEDGIKTYCLGPDWFDAHLNCPLPYPVYKVEDDSLIEAAAA
jgi:predicted RNA-binding Zn-ribbon protein involved in translation (DUF1610 family)